MKMFQIIFYSVSSFFQAQINGALNPYTKERNVNIMCKNKGAKQNFIWEVREIYFIFTVTGVSSFVSGA